LLRADPDQLQAALDGQVREHHRFLLRLHLTQIEAMEAGLRTGEGEAPTADWLLGLRSNQQPSG
jgi:hypothetical protein